MQLQDFVQKTIVQIVRGIEGAQDELRDSSAKINPSLDASGTAADFTNNGLARMRQKEGGGLAQVVKFDVAVTATEGESGKAGIGVFAGALNVGGAVKSESSSSSVSRVQFSVPLSFPPNS